MEALHIASYTVSRTKSAGAWMQGLPVQWVMLDCYHSSLQDQVAMLD